MQKYLKLTSFLTAVLVISGCVLSCGKNGDQTSDTTSGVTGSIDTSTTGIEEKRDVFDGIEIKNYDGREFNILCRNEQKEMFYSEGENGDLINDAVYKRNALIEDRFGVKINTIAVPGDWDSRTTFIKNLQSSIMAADGAYDLVDGYAAIIGDLVATKLFLNLNEVPHLRPNEAWWSQDAAKELSVNGKLYCLPGDLSINLWDCMMVFLFNKKLVSDYALEDPYKLVSEGKWTYDKLIEMCKGQYADLNNDGKMDAYDKYGCLFVDDLQFNNFHSSFNIPFTQRDANGLPVLNLNTPQMVDYCQKAYDLAYNTDGIGYINTAGPDAEKSFANNNMIFMPCLLRSAGTLRDMESSFGILPYPKYDEAQKEYGTTSRDNHSMYCIPIDVKDADFAGRITEALCAAGHEYLVPAYFEQTLKLKYARDDESIAMLDLIRSSLNFDFAVVFAVQTERSGFLVRDVVNNKLNFTSEYEKKISKFNKAMEKFLVSYSD